MPHKRELTWQSGSPGRPGRWKKIYRGQAYYFAGGRGKSDQDAYQVAIKDWRQQEQRIQSAAPRRHQAAYEQEIAKWQEVLTWSRQHGEHVMADTATERVQELAPIWLCPSQDRWR